MVVHGVILWTIFLLALASGLIGLWNLRPEWITIGGLQQRMRRLTAGVWVAAAAAWLAVLTGTFILFPSYRAKPPEGADLAQFPRAYLLSQPELAEWNDAMEWKQQLAWFAPILATAAAYVVVRYGPRLAHEPKIRRALIVLLTIAFLAAATAGGIGAFINKIVPLR
ncbi:MAG TPA: hypothetical protein VGA73_07975 [Candidatus Binatia bacterium]